MFGRHVSLLQCPLDVIPSAAFSGAVPASLSLFYGSCGAVVMLALVISLVSEVDRAVQMNVQSRRERFRELNCNAG